MKISGFTSAGNGKRFLQTDALRLRCPVMECVQNGNSHKGNALPPFAGTGRTASVLRDCLNCDLYDLYDFHDREKSFQSKQAY
jgi:hypothetical protein